MLDEGVDAACRYLGLEHRTVCRCERDAYAAAVLVARMADKALGESPIWDSLETFDGQPWRGVVDLVTASPPCQPYSSAGKQLGHDDERSSGPLRHLIRIIAECEPALVFLENVSPWVRGGWFRPFGEELCRLGYTIESPLFITAKSVGASHLRERVFVLAHRDCERRQQITRGASGDEAANGRARRNECEPDCNHKSVGSRANMADAQRNGRRQAEPREAGRGSDAEQRCDDLGNASGQRLPITEQQELRRTRRRHEGRAVAEPGRAPLFAPGPADPRWRDILAESPHLAPAVEPHVCRIPDGDAGWVDDSRADKLRCIGNSVVAPCAAVAFIELMRRIVK